MDAKQRDRQLSILSILRSSERPLSSSRIHEALVAAGHQVSERTVRYYLKQMEETGLSRASGRRGHSITERGLTELDSRRTAERVGFLSAKIDQMSYRMSFDLTNKTGTVVTNITLVEPRELAKRIEMICKVFEEGYALGRLVTLFDSGESVGHMTVPEGMVGLGTVCSITLNGVLLKHGIPTNSRFGGLLELRDKKPIRFVEIITYEGTSIDPLEIFIRSGMTDYLGAIKTGSGRIGASFREFPSDSCDLVEELAQRLDRVGLGGFMSIGRTGQTLLEIPVSEGRVGAIVIGGLNPVSILEETGVRAYSRALAGLIDFNRLFPYEDLASYLNAYV
jgi:HTH-type transcriptional regulator, global nitrogen regulator NrpRI